MLNIQSIYLHGEIADEGSFRQLDLKLSFLCIVGIICKSTGHLGCCKSEGDIRANVKLVNLRIPALVVLNEIMFAQVRFPSELDLHLYNKFTD